MAKRNSCWAFLNPRYQKLHDAYRCISVKESSNTKDWPSGEPGEFPVIGQHCQTNFKNAKWMSKSNREKTKLIDMDSLTHPPPQPPPGRDFLTLYAASS